jgi:polyisoprenoid-binding protein YceI
LAVPTFFFGLFRVPALFGLTQASDSVRAGTADTAFTVHYLLAYAAIALAVMHVGAALKHHIFDRDEVLAHMVPGLRAPFETEPRPKNPARLAVLGFGLGLVGVALAAALFTASSIVSAPPAAAPQTTVEIAEPAPTAPSAPSIAVGEPNPSTPQSSSWAVDRRSSSLGFAYTYTDDSGDTACTGRFSSWSANIRFDPNDLEHSSVTVRIQVASARTGITAHDSALPSSNWFNAAANPTVEFRTTRIRAREGGRYEAEGDLTIRGETKRVRLPFTLTINGDQASMRGALTIDRHDFNIGNGDDSADSLISRDIVINVRVEATRTP